MRRIRKAFVRQLLDPVPGLEFFPLVHRYRLFGEWLPYNVSTVLSYDMSPTQRAAIERTKDGPDGWAERGRTIHRVLCDEFLQGEGSIYDEKWTPWIEPLLDEPLFKGVETLATEYAVCDKIKRVGGSFACCEQRIPTISGLFWATSRRSPLKRGSLADAQQLPSSRLTGASLRCTTLRWW